MSTEHTPGPWQYRPTFTETDTGIKCLCVYGPRQLGPTKMVHVLENPDAEDEGDAMNIGPRIKALREEMGLTQQECAEDAGMSQSMWADIEADRGNPTLDTLVRIAGALGATLADLLP